MSWEWIRHVAKKSFKKFVSNFVRWTIWDSLGIERPSGHFGQIYPFDPTPHGPTMKIALATLWFWTLLIMGFPMMYWPQSNSHQKMRTDFGDGLTPRVAYNSPLSFYATSSLLTVTFQGHRRGILWRRLWCDWFVAWVNVVDTRAAHPPTRSPAPRTHDVVRVCVDCWYCGNQDCVQFETGVLLCSK